MTVGTLGVEKVLTSRSGKPVFYGNKQRKWLANQRRRLIICYLRSEHLGDTY